MASAGRPDRSGIASFYFSAYLPGKGYSGLRVNFDAHIIGVTDTSSPSWHEEFDMGRADPVMMYRSFSRSVQIGFIVVSLNPQEHKDNYESLSRLGTMTYPVHEFGSGFNGVHVLFGIGTLLTGFGVITAFDANWTGETPWVGDPSKGEIPKPLLTDASINLKILSDSQGNRPAFQGGNYKYWGF